LRSLLYIGNKLSHHGFSPGVIETLGMQLEEAGYRVYYAGSLKNQFMRLLQMLYKTLTTGRKVDYILIDTYSTSAFWYAYLTGRLAKFLGKKYIPILHGGDLPARLKRSKRACDKLFRNAHTNVAVSGYLQNAFENHSYAVTLIPNNIDLYNYKFKLREHPKPAILWVRAFSKIYNPTMAVDVLEELLKTYHDAELCMVGPDKDGSLKEFTEYARKKGINTHIKITGKLTREEWTKLSERYDFFINTTNVDNTPVSVIEAMALGLYVVSTDPGGIPWLLMDGKDALLIKPGNSIAMADKIDHLVKNYVKAMSLSLAARKKAELFDWNVIKTNWLKLLS